MIKFPNGNSVTFLCASGALGLDGLDSGNGIIKLWKMIFRWLGYHKPGEWGLITKTLTYKPRPGRLKWWCPWRCVRKLGGGNYINSVGLTNPGYRAWIDHYYARALKTCKVVIPSITFDTSSEAFEMIEAMNTLDGLSAVEINVSCPNVGRHLASLTHLQTIKNLCGHSRHPLIVKLGPDLGGIAQAIEALDGSVFAFDLINTVPFTKMYPGAISPLARYGLEGGVSGPVIKEFATAALRTAVSLIKSSYIISGGGIDSDLELSMRRACGADAYTIGVAFLRPWLPLRLKRNYGAAGTDYQG